MNDHSKYRSPDAQQMDHNTMVALGALGVGAVALYYFNRPQAAPARQTTTQVTPPPPAMPPIPFGPGGSTGACPPGQIFDGITGQCRTPLSFPNSGCPVNYTFDPTTNTCRGSTTIQAASVQSRCAQIGANYDPGSGLCVYPSSNAGELLAPAGVNIYGQPLPAQFLPTAVPVPKLCASGFFWDQQSYPGQPALGCIPDPTYPSGAPVGTCPQGLAFSQQDNACH